MIRKTIFVSTFLVLLVTACQAEVVLDQEFVPTGQTIFTQFNQRAMAQTFTAGTTGWLTELEVLVSRLNPEGNLIVEIQQGVSEGVVATPATVMASVSVPLEALPANAPPQFVSVSLPAPGLRVTQGDELAIVLFKDRGGQFAAGGVVWKGSYVTGSQPNYLPGMALQFRPAGWYFNLDGASFYLPDRWEPNPQLGDYGFRTCVDPIPEPATITILALGSLMLLKRKP